MQKIITWLWFDNQAEEAAAFYTSLFDDSCLLTVSRYGDAGPGPAGSAMVVKFELAGQQFLALNGGPHFRFTEAISLLVNCDTQEEVDELWAKLTEGGEPSQCGWLKDRYGLSWQVIPTALPVLLSDPEPARAQRAMQEMLGMQKIDIAALRRAVEGLRRDVSAAGGACAHRHDPCARTAKPARTRPAHAPLRARAAVAVAHYDAVLAAWANADPALRGRVQEVARRRAALVPIH
jgi:predicted 3-demethylubiquinone-9 3-methyltransferase (glyoxalase superfamily)